MQRVYVPDAGFYNGDFLGDDVFISEATPYLPHEGDTDACKYCDLNHELFDISFPQQPRHQQHVYHMRFRVGMGEHLPPLHVWCAFAFRGSAHADRVHQHIRRIAAKFAGRSCLRTRVPSLKEVAARTVLRNCAID